MATQANPDKSPGTMFTLKFGVTASVLLGLAVVLVTICYAQWPQWQETMKFCLEASTVAAGLLTAFYVGKELRETVRQRAKALGDKKIDRSFEFIRRWNDPAFEHTKHEFRSIVESGKVHDTAQVEEILGEDTPKRTNVVEVLNFFEEIAQAANMQLADDEALKRYFEEALTYYYSTLGPWMQRYRATRSRPMMWVEIQSMLSRWRDQ
jgi:AcrR family transcriptional regulator